MTLFSCFSIDNEQITKTLLQQKMRNEAPHACTKFSIEVVCRLKRTLPTALLFNNCCLKDLLVVLRWPGTQVCVKVCFGLLTAETFLSINWHRILDNRERLEHAGRFDGSNNTKPFNVTFGLQSVWPSKESGKRSDNSGILDIRHRSKPLTSSWSAATRELALEL